MFISLSSGEEATVEQTAFILQKTALDHFGAKNCIRGLIYKKNCIQSLIYCSGPGHSKGTLLYPCPQNNPPSVFNYPSHIPWAKYAIVCKIARQWYPHNAIMTLLFVNVDAHFIMYILHLHVFNCIERSVQYCNSIQRNTVFVAALNLYSFVSHNKQLNCQIYWLCWYMLYDS